MKIYPVQWEPLFHVDRWTDKRETDMAKLMVIFCNFANVPNKVFRLKMNDKIQRQDNQS